MKILKKPFKMKQFLKFSALICIIFATGCKSDIKMNKDVKTPEAEIQAKSLTIHNSTRIDNYFWMRLTDDQKTAKNKDAQTQKVEAYLNSENEYFDQVTASTNNFQKELFEEMKGRIKEDDTSVPYFRNDYFYITRFEKGNQYPIYSRKKDNLESIEEVLFNVNKEAEGYEYFQLGGLNVSPNNTLVAFATDTVSRRQYTIQIKNLETGNILTDKIENTTGGSVWSNDNKTLFYTKKDPLTLRSSSIYRHILGTDASEDVIVFEEKDETYSTYVYKTKSHKFIVIGSSSTLSSEFRIISADNPYGDWKIIQPREDNLEYSLAHYGDYFYIQTNKDDAINFKLMKTPVNKTTKENWVDVIPHRKETLLEDVSIFKNYLVIEERTQGLGKIRIKTWDGKEDYYLPFDEETYSAGVYANPEFDTDVIRYSYNSMTTPNSVIDFNMKNQTKEVKKEQEVLGGKFNKNNYKSERVWATARDGKKVAI